MQYITIRDLRNHGGDVVDRVLSGERLTVTRAGKPVAELRPLPRPGLDAAALLSRFVDPEALPDVPTITAITLAKLSVDPLVATSASERAARQAHLQQAEADFDPLPFDAAAARAFGVVAADLENSISSVQRRLLKIFECHRAIALKN